MKKIFGLLLAIFFILPLLSVAQAPDPINDDLLQSLIGDWEGWWERHDGKHKTWMKRAVAVDGQYYLVEAELGFQYPYRGMGTWTKDPDTGEWLGHWFDNYRRHHTGRGVREGNKLIMVWTSWGGHTRIIEKINDYKMTLTVLRPGPNGKSLKEVGTYTRKEIRK
jgi:hypothetical protein